MSEPIPEAIPTSISNRSRRPTKKRALGPSDAQSAQVEALFAHPERAAQGIAVGPKTRTAAPPPEIVANVQGSSAGAGSGEFHVYKASRRREYERLRLIDEETKIEEAEKEFQSKKEDRMKRDEEKLSKNRAKREKLKKRQEKKRLTSPAPVLQPDGASGKGEAEGLGLHIVKKKPGPAKVPVSEIGREDGQASLERDHVEAGAETGITIHDDD